MNVYEVQRGDSLSVIAKRNGVSVEYLAKINGIKDVNDIKAGQKLIFSLPENNDDNGYNATNLNEPDNISEHKVKRGDSLWKLAKQYGCTIDALKAANNLKSDTIQRGQVLIIPSVVQNQVSVAEPQITQPKAIAEPAIPKMTLKTASAANSTPQENVKNDIRKAEGKEPATYFAPEGKSTIGFGHQLVNKPKFIKNIEAKKLTPAQKNELLEKALKNNENKEALKTALKKDLAEAIKRTGIKNVPTTINSDLKLTEAQMELLLSSDVKKASDNAEKNLGKTAFNRLSGQQKEVMIDLYYNIGEGFHKKGPTFMKLVKAGKLEDAQAQLDFYRSNGKLLRGLMKRSMERMKKWNNGVLTDDAKKSLLENYNKLAVQDGKKQVSTFALAERKIMA